MQREKAPAPAPVISDVQIRFVADGRDGLLGWASLVIDGAIRLNDLALRRGQHGDIYITFPARISPAGDRRYRFHPISSDATALLERAILSRVRELLGPGAAADAGEGG